jgi:hypothetical protein
MKHFAKNILKVRVPKKNKIKFVKINFYDVSVILFREQVSHLDPDSTAQK